MAITIIKQPTNITAAIGTTATFVVEATGDGLTYQWQYFTSTTNSWLDSSTSGNKTNALKVAAETHRNGYKYRCVITDANGDTVTTDEVMLTIVPIVITKQPTNLAAVTGSTVIFTVEATGEGLSYQWEYLKPTSTTWVKSAASGATRAQVTFTASEAMNGYVYHCIITDANGNTVTTDEVTLTVAPIVITKQPTNKVRLIGDTVYYTVEAAGQDLTYQWEFKNPSIGEWGASEMPGNTTTSISVEVTKARNGYKYRCKITDASGNVLYTDAAALFALDTNSEIGFMSSQTMTAIGDLIREKEGTSDRIIPANMEPRLRAIIENAVENANVEFQTLEGTVTLNTSVTGTDLGVTLPESDSYVLVVYRSSRQTTTNPGTVIIVEWKLGQELNSLDMYFSSAGITSAQLTDVTAIYPSDSGNGTKVVANHSFGKAVELSWRYMYV